MKRKLLALLIIAALIFAMFPCSALALDTWDGTVDTSWYDGSESYFISTAEQLAGLAVLVNQGAAESGNVPVNFSGETIGLSDDIDLSGHDWVPIGLWQWSGPDYSFSGTFNGHGHTISNMTVNDPAKIGVGLFGYTTGAMIDGLGIVNCDVSGQGMVGGLAGFADELTSIHTCYTTGTVKAIYTEGAEGYNGEIVGGLVGNYGQALSSIDRCYSTASVDGDRFAGGLVGYSSRAHISNSYATGDVITGSEANDVGGFIGSCDQSVIELCFATGDVTAGGNVGGFVGDTYSNGSNNTITNCYARGNVTSTYDWGWCAGGFAGSIEDTDFYNCYSTGNVSFTASTGEAYHIGGFFGVTYSGDVSFTSCFFDATVTGREAVGNSDDAGSSAYTGITGLSTANMQGWDALFNTVKMNGLDSGAGAPLPGETIWYPHTSDYPDFMPESCSIAFDSQGATTPASPATSGAAVGGTADSMPLEPSRTGFTFGGWWTGTLGEGTEFTDSTPVPGDMTVYALWLNESSSSVYVGGRVTLAHAGPAGGTWGYDEDFVTLEDLGDGTVRVTGVAAGTTQVVYITSETVEIFDVTILDSNLPSTGQDATPMYLLGGIAILLLGAGTITWILSVRRKQSRI